MKRFGVLLFLLLAAIACGSSDSGGDGSGIFTAAFAPANGNPAGPAIAIEEGGQNGPTVTVEVKAVEITDLYGVSYILIYSPAILEFVGAEESGHLKSGGTATTFQVALEGGSEGRLVVGHSRVGAVPGVDGSGTLHKLTFRGIAAGTTPLSFENLRAADSTGALIPGVTGYGGSVTVTEQ